jgi:hypothetical protein
VHLCLQGKGDRDACMVNMDSLLFMPWIVNVYVSIAAETKPSCLGSLLAPKARNRVHVLVHMQRHHPPSTQRK